MNARHQLLGEAPATERAEPIVANPCDQLPAAARDLLHLASQVRDPRERRIAIDDAIERVKVRFPEFFRQ